MAKYSRLTGKNALSRACAGDVVAVTPDSDIWHGPVWGLFIHNETFEVVAAHRDDFDDVMDHWCSPNKTISTIQHDDTVRLYKPENAPQKFWVWLAQKRLNDDTIVAY